MELHHNDRFKNFTTIHFRLSSIDILEVVLHLMAYLVKYVLVIQQ